MSIPNLLMVVATLAVFYVMLPVGYIAISNGNAGVDSGKPEYIISHAVPGVMMMFLFVGILIYGIIRYRG